MVDTPEGSILYVCTKFEADISIPSKVIMGPKISKLGHVTQATSTKVRIPDGSVLCVRTKFEADSAICSKVIMGVPKFGNWVT